MLDESFLANSVQEITDESAASHSGGFSFQWFRNSSGSGAAPGYNLDPNATVVKGGLVQSFQLAGGLSSYNNDIEAIKVDGVQSGREYTVNFYDNTNFTGAYTSRKLTSANNGDFRVLSEFLNRTGSIRIVRSA